MNDVLERSKRIQNQRWDLAVLAGGKDRSPVFASFMLTLNEMIDLDAKRLAARENQIPSVIWVLILIVAFFATFTTGLGLERRFWFPAAILPLMLAVSISLIADLDAPTFGFIRTDQRALQRLLLDLRR